MSAFGGFRGIAFLTDYGLEDAFVAVCHGALLGIAPRARVVDISHLVAPQDVRRGAHLLASAAPYLTPMVFLAVVDPGVGSERRAVALRAGESVFVGPDNGLMMEAADRLGGVAKAVVLDRPELFRHPVSATFHGRDVFAPIAARLFIGTPLTDVGSTVDAGSLRRLQPPVSRRGEDWVDAEVVHVDRFGNLVIHAGADDLKALAVERGGRVRVGEVVAVVGRQFASVASGEVVLYLDSDDLLSIAVNQGRADEILHLGVGDVVRVTACASPG
jgi:S-adenosyl-L-methionine hydrolase (adenosine-forming)